MPCKVKDLRLFAWRRANKILKATQDKRASTSNAILRVYSNLYLKKKEEKWLGNLDSNQDRRSQSPLFYH